MQNEQRNQSVLLFSPDTSTSLTEPSESSQKTSYSEEEAETQVKQEEHPFTIFWKEFRNCALHVCGRMFQKLSYLKKL